MKSWRVRRLTRQGPGVGNSDLAASALSAIAEQAGAVFDVTAEEKLLTHYQVVHQLELGLLQPTDLVQIDGQWVSLGDAEPFAPPEAQGEHWEYDGEKVAAVFHAVLFFGLLLIALVAKLLQYFRR